MSKSSKKPEPPPEPNPWELIQNEVAKFKRLLGLDVNRLALGSEVEGITGTGPFGPVNYTITGVNVIEFVNVSTSLGPSQGGSPPPPQVTGLSASVISNTQINLAWTAYGGSDFNFYTVYRGTSPGFSADSSSDIATPTTNSYNNTGLTAGTAYYYRVATTNDANIEGALSSEASGTTTGGGDVTPPGQTTGLSASVISNTQINLSWTASTAGDLNHYDVHQSTTSGFTPAVGNRIAQPTSNSYNNTGLTDATTYYYKVGAIDNSNNIGTYSTQVSATTTSAITHAADFLLHFDGNFVDSSTNGLAASYSAAGNGWLSPGQFGSGAWKCNAPTSSPGGVTDRIEYDPIPTPLQMDTTTGFSFSFWIYPTDISALSQRRVIIDHGKDASNMFSIQISSGGTVYFFVKKAGVDYKTQKGGFVTGSWQHVAAVFNGAANTVTIYKDGVAGGTSTQSTEYPTHTDELEFGVRTGTGLEVSQFEGYIDEIQYFKAYVLSAAQITNLMNTNAI